MSEELAAAGRDTRTKLWGAERLEAADRFLNDFDVSFATFLNEHLFGTVWKRPGIDMKTRSMLTVGALVAMGKSHEMRLHMNGALSIGISEDEIKEIVVHMAYYAGVPATIEGIRALNEVVASRGRS